MQHHRTFLAVAVGSALMMMPIAVRAHDPGWSFAGVGTATIDGRLAPGEWDGAASHPITAIALPSGAMTSGQLLVMNDATNLYLAVRMDLPAAEPPFAIFFVSFEFDDDHDDHFVLGDDLITATFYPTSGSSQPEDCFVGSCPYDPARQCGLNDVSYGGGQSNVLAAIVNAGTAIVAELAHPLDSGDSRDFSLAPGDVVGFRMGISVYFTGSGGTLTPVSSFYPADMGGDILVSGGAVPIEVAIGSGAEAPCVNNNGRGVIPITILGSATLAVTKIDPSTLRLDSLAVKVVGPTEKALVHYEDVNADGFVDLVAQMQDVGDTFTTGQANATITATLIDGTRLSGTAPMCVVPDPAIRFGERPIRVNRDRG